MKVDTASTTYPRVPCTGMRLVRFDDVEPRTWRNGGGRTRELLAWPTQDAWNVRVSVADVASDGPFSAFDGVQRWFAVLEGEGVELTIDGRPQRVVRGAAPLLFSGASTVRCRLLDGSTRDLNFMLRDVPGRMRATTGDAAWHPARSHCGVFSAVAGQCVADGVPIAVPARALLWFGRAPASLSFEAAVTAAENVAWWMEAGDERDVAATTRAGA